ncbi:MAG: amino acid adenylation domain-containing protein [Halanaerobiales bacterium]|nr:amino acid adenylation domain-containing protein [Halanaerobiales bacterium]
MKEKPPKDLFPLTSPQRRIWYNEKLHSGTSLNVIGGTALIKGLLNKQILEEAINLFIKQHDGIRLHIVEIDLEVEQYAKQYEYKKIDYFDFSKDENPLEHYTEWLERESHTSISLADSNLYYFAIFKITDQSYGFMVKLHHIIADGWSMQVLATDVIANYKRLLAGEPVEEEKPSYLEYISKEQEYLKSKRFMKNKQFWHNKLGKLDELPLSKTSENSAGNRLVYKIDHSLTKKIRDFVDDQHISTATFLLSIFILYFSKFSQSKEVMMGIPVLNRSGKREKGIFGMFTSTVPFYANICSEWIFEQFISYIKDELFLCYLNSKYPYDRLVSELEINGTKYSNFFNTAFNYYNTPFSETLNDKPVVFEEFYNGHQFYSLQLIIKEWSDQDQIELDYDYKISDYRQGDIDEMYTRFCFLIRQILDNPGERIEDVNILTNEEKNHFIYEFNRTDNTPVDKHTLMEIFDSQVLKTPTNIAVFHEDSSVTYQELSERINSLGVRLMISGVNKGDIVGIFTTHSIETVVGIMAVLKIGAAFLPFDHHHPVERIKYIIDDANLKLMLTNCELDSSITEKIMSMDLNEEDLDMYPTESFKPVSLQPDDLAYVIYTSGSTGRAKGVMIESSSITNYVLWAITQYEIEETDCFAFYSSLAFDFTLTSLFVPLLGGGSVGVYSETAESHVLYKIIDEKRASIIKVTPSHLVFLNEHEFADSTVTRIIVGGENFPVELTRKTVNKFTNNVKIYNEYGPTEATIGCIIYKYNPEKDNGLFVPIGYPIDHVQIYLLDNQLQPVGINMRGELYISGISVARGYINNPKMNQERFMDNPFVEGMNMYKTGDIAKFIDSNTIEFIGRDDSQIKIRGYRVELQEIEACLLRYPMIVETVVLVNKVNETEYICAYVAKKEGLVLTEINNYLIDYMPRYMLPDIYIELDAIPLTNNGKVNYQELPMPELQTNAAPNKYTNDLEKILVDILREVLHHDFISLDDSYYHLGGDSIKAISISQKLYNLGYSLMIKDILLHPVIKEMAAYITDNTEVDENRSQLLMEGDIAITPIVHWFFKQNFLNPGQYNQSVLLSLYTEIEVSKLEQIFAKLIRHHDALRINYNAQKKTLYYNNSHLEQQFKINIHEKTDQSEINFDLENVLLIRVDYLDLGAAVKYLKITIHHLAIDIASWEIILNDLSILLKQYRAGEELHLPPKTDSYQKWAKRTGSKLVIPDTYTKREDLSVADNNSVVRSIDLISIRDQIEEFRYLYNLKTDEVFAIIFALTFTEFFESHDFFYEIESHGREFESDTINIERTVGWFTAINELHISLREDDLSKQIISLKEQLRKEGHKFADIEGDHDLVKTVRFNYIGSVKIKFDEFLVKGLNELILDNQSKENKMSCFFDVNLIGDDTNLDILIRYNRNEISDVVVSDFIETFVFKIQEIVKTSDAVRGKYYSPSDFDAIEISMEDLEMLSLE